MVVKATSEKYLTSTSSSFVRLPSTGRISVCTTLQGGGAGTCNIYPSYPHSSGVPERQTYSMFPVTHPIPHSMSLSHTHTPFQDYVTYNSMTVTYSYCIQSHPIPHSMSRFYSHVYRIPYFHTSSYNCSTLFPYSQIRIPFHIPEIPFSVTHTS